MVYAIVGLVACIGFLVSLVGLINAENLGMVIIWGVIALVSSTSGILMDIRLNQEIDSQCNQTKIEENY